MRGWEVGEEAGCVVLAGLTHLATLVAVGPCLYGPDGFDPLGLQLCFGGDDRLPCLLRRIKCSNVALNASLLARRLVVGASLELAAGGLADASRVAIAASRPLAQRAIGSSAIGSASGSARVIRRSIHGAAVSTQVTQS